MILIVEDDRMIAELAQNVLEQAGHSATIAGTAEEAVSLIQGGLEPQLIILDLLLPGMDGNDFLENLKGHQKVPPVIVLSARLEGLRDSLRPWVRGEIAKPFARDKFLETVNSALNPKIPENGINVKGEKWAL